MHIRPRVVRYDHTLPWSPTDRDVLMDRRPVFDPDAGELTGVVERYNIRQELSPILGVGFGWGEDQPGGLVLAVNILDRFLGSGPGDWASCWGVTLPCRQLAVILAGPFWGAHLVGIGWHGGVISGGVIAEWVAGHRGAWEIEGIDLADDGAGLGAGPVIVKEVRE